MYRFIEFCKQNRWAIGLAVAGLILAILFFTIGFIKTILTVLIIGICCFLGYLMDRGGVSTVKSFFSTLFQRKN